MNFPEYLYQLAETLTASEGPKLAYLLRPTSPHGKELVKQFRNTTVRAFSRPIRDRGATRFTRWIG